MSPQSLHVLLVESLTTWRVAGHVNKSLFGDGLVVNAGDIRLEITRATSSLPFRWLVQDDRRGRGFASVPALLRGLRRVLDPAHPMVPVRIARLPPAAS